MTLASLKGQQVRHGMRNELTFVQTVLTSDGIDSTDHAMVPAIFGVSYARAGVSVGHGQYANGLQQAQSNSPRIVFSASRVIEHNRKRFLI